MAIFYFAEKIVQETARTSFVGVCCDSCGFDYYYPLTRIGHGYDTAHYGLGAKSAEKNAAASAGQDLSQRLGSEAELVPCPRCGWISQELVSGYRRGRFLKLQTSALVIPIVGIAITGIVALILKNGPIQDRRYIEPVLIVGLSFFLLLGAGLYSLRVALTANINPNRNYPQPPDTPLGTPLAYTRNEAGEFILADVSQIITATPKLLMQIGRHRMNYTDHCCDCNKDSIPLKEFETQILGHTTKLYLARCSDCANTKKKQYWRNWLTAFCLSLLLITPLVLMLSKVTGNILGAACMLLPINFAVAAYWASSRTSSAWIHSVDTSRGLLTLTFPCKAFERYVAKCITEDDTHATIRFNATN